MKCLEPTDKEKSCLEILQDVQMDVRGGLTNPMKKERVLREVLFLYKIT